MEIFDLELLRQTVGDLRLIYSFLIPYKWVVLPILAWLLFLILKDALLFASQAKFKSKIEWEMIEIRIPREIQKGPRAMEQFFASFWTLFNIPASWKEKYFDGEVTRWYSFEIVGSGGKTNFYIRVPKNSRHLVESMLYAHYPDIEIVSVLDYAGEIPDSFAGLERKGWDLFGVELALKNPSPNPITTYMVFEEKGGEERIIDPISMLLETMARLRPEERAYVQLVVRPVLPDWQKEGQKLIDEVKEKLAPKPKPGETSKIPIMTAVEEEKIKMISRKISKTGFSTIVRTMYLAPKDIFDRSVLRNLTGYFNQYSSNLNYFAFNTATITGAAWYRWPFLFPGRRAKTKKNKMLRRFVQRYIPEATFFGRLSDPDKPVFSDAGQSISILNTEELATLYHPPTNVVLTAPSLDRLESKRVSPPGYIPF